MPSVLFVCTANRFRSPLAAAVFRKVLEETPGTETWTVDSAGTWTESGFPALPEVLLIARQHGVDLAEHRSKPLSPALLSRSDLIVVMDSGHREALQFEFPSSRDRVYLLSQVAEGRTYDIPDPIDSAEAMLDVGSDVCELVRRGAGEICGLAARLSARRSASDEA